MDITRLSIVNKALIKLGQQPVEDLNNEENRNILVNIIYDSVCATEQQSYRWNFCLARVSSTPTENTPAFGFKYEHQLPKDFLRMVSIKDIPFDYSIEGDKLLVNASGDIKYIYLKNETDECKFPPTFADVVSSKIAIELSEKYNCNKDLIIKNYYFYVSVAKKCNAIQRPPIKQNPTEWELSYQNGGF